MVRHETEQDLVNEQDLATVWASHITAITPPPDHFECWKLAGPNEKTYRMDHLVLKNGQPVGFAEFRCRNYKSDQFSEYLLSLSKYMSMQRLIDHGWPVLFVVRWIDRDSYVNVKPNGITSGLYKRAIVFRKNNARYQTKHGDFEPAISIPMDHFTFFNRDQYRANN